MRACLHPRTARSRALPSRFSGVPLVAGDVLRIEKAGGGDWGARGIGRSGRILNDVLDGYVSRDAAVAVYGADPERLDSALAQWDAGESFAPGIDRMHAHSGGTR